MTDEKAMRMMAGEPKKKLCMMSEKQFEDTCGFDGKELKVVIIVRITKSDEKWMVMFGFRSGKPLDYRILDTVVFEVENWSFINQLDATAEYLLYQGKHCSYLIPMENRSLLVEITNDVMRIPLFMRQSSVK